MMPVTYPRTERLQLAVAGLDLCAEVDIIAGTELPDLPTTGPYEGRGPSFGLCLNNFDDDGYAWVATCTRGCWP